MGTPFPSLDMSNGHESQPFAEQICVANNTANSNGNGENETLIEESHIQIRANTNHYQAPVTMSPRIPRKRIVANNSNSNFQREDDLENDFELHTEDKPLTNVSPSVVITPNSPALRSYSGHEIGSPNNSSGSSYHHHHHHRKANWTMDIEREDDGPEDSSRGRGGREGEEMAETDTEQEEADKKRPKSGVDVSLYTTKKNVAQGMLDIALLSANCSQLKYLLFHYERDSSSLVVGNEAAVSAGSSLGVHHSTMDSWFSSMDFYFIVNLVCIGISITLQVIVGILLILNGRHNIYVHRYQRVADSYSNLILITVFIITIVNIFLSVFISAR